MEEVNITVEGMHCGGCEARIQNVISDIKGVKEVKADNQSGNVWIKKKKKKDLAEVREKIEKMEGFSVKEL